MNETLHIIRWIQTHFQQLRSKLDISECVCVALHDFLASIGLAWWLQPSRARPRRPMAAHHRVSPRASHDFDHFLSYDDGVESRATINRVVAREATCRKGGSFQGKVLLARSSVGLTFCTPQPRFLSKEERAKLAIQRRAEEIKADKEKEERQRKEREAFEKEAEALRANERNGREERDRGRYDRGRCE